MNHTTTLKSTQNLQENKNIIDGGRYLEACKSVRNITPTERLVLITFASHLNFTGNFREWRYCFHDAIAAEIDASRETVSRAFRSLVKKKWVKQRNASPEERKGLIRVPEYYSLTDEFFSNHEIFLKNHPKIRLVTNDHHPPLSPDDPVTNDHNPLCVMITEPCDDSSHLIPSIKIPPMCVPDHPEEQPTHTISKSSNTEQPKQPSETKQPKQALREEKTSITGVTPKNVAESFMDVLNSVLLSYYPNSKKIFRKFEDIADAIVVPLQMHTNLSLAELKKKIFELELHPQRADYIDVNRIDVGTMKNAVIKFCAESSSISSYTPIRIASAKKDDYIFDPVEHAEKLAFIAQMKQGLRIT